MTIHCADLEQFQREVVDHGGPVVVDFAARWCGPCKALAPVLAGLSRDHAGRIKVVTVDVDQAPEIAQAYGVRSMPTLIAFRGGRPVGQLVGFSGRAPVEKLFAGLS